MSTPTGSTVDSSSHSPSTDAAATAGAPRRRRRRRPAPRPSPPHSNDNVDTAPLNHMDRTIRRAAAKGSSVPGLSGWSPELLEPLLENPQGKRMLAVLLEDMLTIGGPHTRLLTATRLVATPTNDQRQQVRPIAVGEYFARLAISMAVDKMPADRLKAYFDCGQFGPRRRA